jgi:two-component system sensor histidine kinase KdpD
MLFPRRMTSRYALAAISPPLVTGAMVLARPLLEPANLSLIYLLTVLVVATFGGTIPGVLASIISFLAYNFFFVQPLYVLTVANPQDVARLGFFLLAALFASSLAGLVRRQATQISQRAAALEALYELSQAISGQIDLDLTMPAVAEHSVELLHIGRCALTVQTPAGERTYVAPAIGPTIRGERITVPLAINERTFGAMMVTLYPRQSFGAGEQQLLVLLAGQATLAAERARLAAQLSAQEALEAADRFKSSLLSSVSHDLRSPLATITGVASALRARNVPWDSERAAQMLDTLLAEAARLDRLVGNLLAMSRIEGGSLHLPRDWEDVGDLIGAVLARLRPQIGARQVRVVVDDNLPLIWVNAALIDQALTNLVENALKHTPEGTAITMSTAATGGELQVRVADAGPGIPPEALPRLFEKFYRVAGPERRAPGIGLGLAITKGIVEAHGGRVWAENGPSGGAIFTIALPLQPHGAPALPDLDSGLEPASPTGENEP